MKPFRLAMAQMRVEGGRKQENLERAQARIAESAKGGAKVVLLPEALDLGWTHSSANREAEAIPAGKACQCLVASAIEWGVFVCAGLVERSDCKVFNSAVLINPLGEVLLRHRKINELEIGHPYYSLGDKIQVATTALGTFGLMICADAFARGQVISRSLALMGADMILSPCAWAVTADHDNAREPYGQLWQDNYGPVARDFRLWIAGVSNVGWLSEGPWKGHKCIGCSLLIGPEGKEILQGPYGPEADKVLYADITPVAREAQGDGWERLWKERSTP